MLAAGNLPRLVTNLIGIHGFYGLLPLLAIWAVFGSSLVQTLLQSSTQKRSCP